MSDDKTLIDTAARDRIKYQIDDTIFVEAGAGSGKTAALVGRITELVSVGQIPIEQIAAVTFTERAAAELRERLRERFEYIVRERPEHVAVASRAIEDLDLAPIGTLHSFAQRILSEHPIEAGIPPMIEVLDDVSSSVAFESRWRLLSRDLLDDDEMATTVELLRPLDINLDKVRALVAQLGNDWDLVEDRVHNSIVEPSAPDLANLLVRGREVASLKDECIDPTDKLLPYFESMLEWLDEVTAVDSGDLPAVIDSLAKGQGLKWSNGKKASWSGREPKEIRAECKEWQQGITVVLGEIKDVVLRNLVKWCGSRVLDAARDRQRSGRLEFHDLLVLSRNLLRSNPEVRASLQQRYPRLLLDEFQDTDPIQIEIAVRIAGGADAGAPDWTDIAVPPGSLFVVGDPKQSIYRFRRADIGMYLKAQEAIGGDTRLTTNFRTGAPILQWVNEVFDQLITFVPDSQPHYQALDDVRAGPDVGPAVAVLGADEHTDKPNAAVLREREAADIAATIVTALDPKNPWTTEDRDETRPLRPGDITVLVPSRTSLPALEDALDRVGIQYRAEASSLAYAGSEVRSLLAACRALADTSDHMSLLTALRSPLFGCSDRDLWDWKRGGSRIALYADPPEGAEENVVGTAIRYLSDLRNASRWLTPSEVLSRLVVDRMVFEAAAGTSRPRDVWRRVRFVIDQARAWSESEHGGLRAYTAWAAAQSADTARVSESILPETDVDSVRIMTIHAAKGLEFPMVVMSGMTTGTRNANGVSVLWRSDGYEVSFGREITSAEFADIKPIDEQMSDFERRRLLYVAATRARDHLVISLHRPPISATATTRTNAQLLSEHGAAEAADATRLSWSAKDKIESVPPARPTAPPDYSSWIAVLNAAIESSQRKSSASASGLEGTDPDAVADSVPGSAGLAKGARDVQQSPWAKGRYGSAIGRAVHGVLQSVPLDSATDIASTVESQCVAEGVTPYRKLVGELVRSALDSPVVRRAASRPHWRESYVAMTADDGTVREGIVDLIYREDDGSLVVVDYKTDAIPDAAVDVRTAYYRPQLLEYRSILRAATTLEVDDPVLVFARESGPAAQKSVAP